MYSHARSGSPRALSIPAILVDSVSVGGVQPVGRSARTFRERLPARLDGRGIDKIFSDTPPRDIADARARARLRVCGDISRPPPSNSWIFTLEVAAPKLACPRFFASGFLQAVATCRAKQMPTTFHDQTWQTIVAITTSALSKARPRHRRESISRSGRVDGRAPITPSAHAPPTSVNKWRRRPATPMREHTLHDPQERSRVAPLTVSPRSRKSFRERCSRDNLKSLYKVLAMAFRSLCLSFAREWLETNVDQRDQRNVVLYFVVGGLQFAQGKRTRCSSHSVFLLTIWNLIAACVVAIRISQEVRIWSRREKEWDSSAAWVQSNRTVLRFQSLHLSRWNAQEFVALNFGPVPATRTCQVMRIGGHSESGNFGRSVVSMCKVCIFSLLVHLSRQNHRFESESLPLLHDRAKFTQKRVAPTLSLRLR